MKCSMRVGFAALLIAFIMALAGSVWADITSDVDRVVKAVTDFGLARKTGESGNTITIVNTSGGPLTKDASSYGTPVPSPDTPYWLLLLDLGDITGITIDWKADLTVKGELNWSDPNNSDRNVSVVRFKNGTFNMTDGTIDIQTTGIVETNAIEAEGKSTVTVNGGTLTGEGVPHIGIGADTGGKVIVKSGKVYFPKSLAITTEEFIVEDPSVITGLTNYSKKDSDTKYVDIYGDVYTTAQFLVEPLKNASAVTFTVKNGAKWTLELAKGVDLPLKEKCTFLIEGNGQLILDGEGWLDISGTFTNKGEVTNNANIYNDSANTFDNQGKLTNNGYILNDTTGKMTNTGRIDNTNGRIKNDGVFESVQTPEEMGGEIEGPVQLIGNNSSGGGGCNAGYGFAGLLLLAGFVTRKYRSIRLHSQK